MNGWMLMIGASFITLLWWFSKHTQDNYFIEKSIPKYRTPVRIKDGFYYIVPEKEFIELEQPSNENQQFDSWAWMKSWVDAYEKQVGDGKAKDFWDWIDQQPMQQG